MPLLASANVLRLVDAMAIVLSQAYQLARIRLASAASPVLRMACQRDHALSRLELLRRELDILRAQRQHLPPHRRPDYRPQQRLAILQIKRLRGWSIAKTARRFVLHPNTVRSWSQAIEGRGNSRLLTDAIAWNRIDDLLRWAVHELRRLCPQPELGTRAIARHLLRAGLAISRSSVQRVLRQHPPKRPTRRPKTPMVSAAGVTPHHLLCPQGPNQVWHLDLTTLRLLWRRFTVAAILDGRSRMLLRLQAYARTPRQRDMIRLLRQTKRQYGTPRFLITDHGTQFRNHFHAATRPMRIRHVKGRVRTPYLNGKVERSFMTLRLWWRAILPGWTRSGLQRRLDDYRRWYNHHRPHSALRGLTPQEAWEGFEPPQPIPIRQRNPHRPHITLRRVHCRGDPHLPVIQITVRHAA
jgi:putative transposase